MGTKRKLDLDLLASTLDEAVDSALTARLMLGPTEEITVPTEALDRALQAHPGHQASRRSARERMAVLRERVPTDLVDVLLGYEDASNEAAARAADVGFALGLVGRGKRPRVRAPRR